jgi:DNA-directed RNA polymerase
LLDKELAKKVNLTPQTISEDVQDIYSEIMVDINKAINKFGTFNPNFSYLADVKLTRGILKLSIMTKVYNVTKYGIALQLQNKLQTANVDSKNETSKGGGKIIKSSTSDNVNINNLLKHTWRTDHSGESGDLFKSENSEYTESQTQYYKEGEFKKGKRKCRKRIKG